MLFSQGLIPVLKNNKWGYQFNHQIIIEPQYDTAFAFDATNQIAMVANIDYSKKEINPLTGEEVAVYNYYFITPQNKKIKIKTNIASDSIYEFQFQQELHKNYLNSGKYFKILFQNKAYLCLKSGKQVSKGYNNIAETKHSGFFETEGFVDYGNQSEKVKGLIDSTGFEIAECKYHKIVNNITDSVVYCCSAIFNKKLNDVVLDYKAKLLYSSIKHIEYATKTMRVLQSFQPREEFILENTARTDLFYMEGQHFYYLKDNLALVINGKSWLIYNLQTRKTQKTDSKFYQQFVKQLLWND